MDKFIKRIQSRLSYQKISVSKSLVRETYESIVKNPTSPTEAEISQIIEALKSPGETLETSQIAMTAQSETIEITSQSHPDIWETLQPPTEQPETNTLDSSAEQTTLTKTETNLPTTNPSNNITQQQLLHQIEEKFQNYPLDIKKQLTDYAGQNTFKNLEEAQTFLEQLRSMEFTLMMQLLADHNQKRQNLAQLVSSELSKLENRDTNQRQAFFVGTQTFLETMQQTILQRMNQSAI